MNISVPLISFPLVSDYPTEWEQKVDQVFLQLMAIPDDHCLSSDIRSSIRFVKYSIGHRMTRFVHESQYDVFTLKRVQKEISSTESKLKNLRTLMLREHCGLDALSLFRFMEGNVFCRLRGYQCALDAITAEER